MCVHTCAHTGRCALVHVVCSPKVNTGWYVLPFSTVFLRQVFLILRLTISAAVAARELKRILLRLPRHSGITGAHNSAWLLQGYWESRLKS